jgi:hypothetical protein
MMHVLSQVARHAALARTISSNSPFPFSSLFLLVLTLYCSVIAFTCLLALVGFLFAQIHLENAPPSLLRHPGLQSLSLPHVTGSLP